MKLLIVRHALAEDRDEFFRRTGLDDSLRPLTAEGQAKMRKITQGIVALRPRIELIATSPYQRALETGEILHECYPDARCEQVSLLEPATAPDALSHWLSQQNGNVALVGHEPELSRFAGWLLTGQTESFIRLKKGGVCLLRFDGPPTAGCAELLWLLTPEQLRRLSAARKA